MNVSVSANWNGTGKSTGNDENDRSAWRLKIQNFESNNNLDWFEMNLSH